MQVFGLASVLAYMLASVAVGARLVALARRTGQAPERLIGGAFLLGGALGFPFSVAGTLLRARSHPAALPILALGAAGLAASAILLLLFWRRVFHPNRRGGGFLVALWSGSIVAVTAGLVVGIFLGRPAHENFFYRPSIFLQGAAYGASLVSATRHQAALRRRARIGLGDPEVAHRILLWAVSSGATTLQYGYTLAFLLAGLPIEGNPSFRAVVSTLGLVSSASIVMAFFPGARARRAIARAG